MSAQPETSGVPIPDPAMFPGLLGEIVDAARPYTEADPVGVLVTVLAGAAVLIGPDVYVDIGSSRHRVLIWPMLFGSSGTGRKGEATNTGTLFLQQAYPTFRERTVTGLSSGEGLIEAIRDPQELPAGKGKEPLKVGTEDKRLFCLETEFSSVMSRAARDGNTLNAILRQAWDGSDLMVLNRSQIRSTGSHIGILAHVTPKEFLAKMARADMAGGLFNRFLPVWVDRSGRLPAPRRIPFPTLSSLSSRLWTVIDSAQHQTEIHLTKAAEELWQDEIYDALTPDVDDSEDLASEFTRRSQPYCRRLAALYALLNPESVTQWGRGSASFPRVEIDDLRAAFALVTYSNQSARYVLAGASTDRSRDRLIRAVALAAEDGLSRTQIRDLFSRHKTGTEVDLLVAELEADGRVEVEERVTAGRTRTVVRDVGSALKATEASKAREHVGSALKATEATKDRPLRLLVDESWPAEPIPEEDR